MSGEPLALAEICFQVTFARQTACISRSRTVAAPPPGPLGKHPTTGGNPSDCSLKPQPLSSALRRSDTDEQQPLRSPLHHSGQRASGRCTSPSLLGAAAALLLLLLRLLAAGLLVPVLLRLAFLALALRVLPDDLVRLLAALHDAHAAGGAHVLLARLLCLGAQVALATRRLRNVVHQPHLQPSDQVFDR